MSLTISNKDVLVFCMSSTVQTVDLTGCAENERGRPEFSKKRERQLALGRGLFLTLLNFLSPTTRVIGRG